MIGYGLLSVGLVISAFFGQIQFEACGYSGSNRQCNYALGTGALYVFVAVAILLFVVAVTLVVRAHHVGKLSWSIPLVGSASSILAIVVYFLLMDIATH